MIILHYWDSCSISPLFILVEKTSTIN